MDAWRQPEVFVEFAIDVCQASGDRPRMPRDGKGKPDGVSRGWVRILAKDEYFDVSQWPGESPEKVGSLRKDLDPLGSLSGNKGQSFTELAFHGAQRVRPIRGHELFHGLDYKLGEARVGNAGRFQVKQCILTSHPVIVSSMASAVRMTALLFARNMGVGHFPPISVKECAVAEPAPEPMAPQSTVLALEDLAAETRSDSPLSDRDQQMLALERQWWKYAGAKEQAIRELFNLSATHYYQILNALIDTEDALAHDPMLVKRLRRLRTSRQRARTARRLGSDA